MELKSSFLSCQSNSNLARINVLESNNSNNISLFMLDETSEPVIEIDSDNRKIIIPDVLKNIAVAGDHLSETIYFTVPRYFDGDDLSKRKCLIRFINAGNEYGESDVCDMEVIDNTIKFGWSISNYASRYSGVLKFTVQFETIENGILYQWQTTPAELNILAGLNIEQTISAKDDILFRTLSSQIEKIQKNLVSIQENIGVIPALQETVNKLGNDVEYLKNNVVYVLNE